MDTAIQTTERGPLAGFLLRWLAAWMLATALSAVMLALFDVLDRHHAQAAIYVAIIGLLSLPAVGGLLHGILMRGLLRRSTLWGALTGGGMVIAAMGIVVMVYSFRYLWSPLHFRVTVWVSQWLGLAEPPFGFVGVTVTGVVFGAILGCVQAIVLAPRWRSVMAWIATSIAASVLTGLWLYAWAVVEPVSTLFARIAGLMPLTDQWRYLPVSVLWAEIGAFCFALPTGLLMRRLLRRFQHADAEAIVGRFE